MYIKGKVCLSDVVNICRRQKRRDQIKRIVACKYKVNEGLML